MVPRRVRRFVVAGASVALLAFSPSVEAQDPGAFTDQDAVDRDWTDEIPAHLAIVDGEATIEREGRLERAVPNLALLAGDRLRTQSGRLEVAFADGSVLDLDASSTLDLLSESLARLLDGQLRLSIARTSADLAYRIDTPAASAWIQAAGDYRVRVDADRRTVPQVMLTVWRGSAELSNDYGATLVRPGTYAIADSQSAPSLPYATNSAAFDDFDQWAEARRAERLGSISTRYLPVEVRYDSGVFDRYGTWNYQSPYGYVWYPSVAAGWRPYYDGRWSVVGNFGWFWIGMDRWSWTTHHYGRWGVSAGRWYWIPGAHWAPAWVSWAVAPGYVGWCPLGYDNRAVISIGVGAQYAGLWSAWTVMPSRYFVSNVVVRQHVVVHTALPPAARGQFVEHHAPPRSTTGYARAIEPLRAPTDSRGTAVPRSAVTLPPRPRAAVSLSNPAARSTASPPRDTSATVSRSPSSRSVSPRAASIGPSSPQPEASRTPSRIASPGRTVRQAVESPTSPVAPRIAPVASAPPDASRAGSRTPMYRSAEPITPRSLGTPLPADRALPVPNGGSPYGRSVQRGPSPGTVSPPPQMPTSRSSGSAFERFGTATRPSAPSVPAAPAPSSPAPARVSPSRSAPSAPATVSPPPAPRSTSGGGGSQAAPRRGRGGGTI